MGTWNFDPYHTQVDFSTKHLGMMTVRGHFAEVTVKGDVHLEQPERSKFKASFNTAGIRGARRRFAMSACKHAAANAEVTPSAGGCEDCIATGERWVHLRLCMTCGHVGCCDSSKNRHATRHFHATGHPVMKSFEPGQDWGWCYIDEVELDGSVWPIDGPRAHS